MTSEAREPLEIGNYYKVTTKRLFGPREVTLPDGSSAGSFLRIDEGTILKCKGIDRLKSGWLGRGCYASFELPCGSTITDQIIARRRSKKTIPDWLCPISALEQLATASD